MYGSLFLLILSQQYVHKVFVNICSYFYKPRAPLEDVLHPRSHVFSTTTLRCLSIAGEMMLFFFGISTVWWGITMRYDVFHIILARFALTVVVCQYLRAACFLSTRLPGPAPHCSASYLFQHPEHKVRTFREIFTNLELFRNCGDLIFSSHNIFFVTLCCIVQTYVYSKHAVPFVWVMSLLFNATVLVNKKHYTVDILLAYIIVFLTYEYLLVKLPDEVLRTYVERLPF